MNSKNEHNISTSGWILYLLKGRIAWGKCSRPQAKLFSLEGKFASRIRGKGGSVSSHFASRKFWFDPSIASAQILDPEVACWFPQKFDFMYTFICYRRNSKLSILETVGKFEAPCINSKRGEIKIGFFIGWSSFLSLLLRGIRKWNLIKWPILLLILHLKNYSL